eukprot:scaffold39488_cov29-Tisochrysis_lutea.AAC.3
MAPRSPRCSPPRAGARAHRDPGRNPGHAINCLLEPQSMNLTGPLRGTNCNCRARLSARVVSGLPAGKGVAGLPVAGPAGGSRRGRGPGGRLRRAALGWGRAGRRRSGRPVGGAGGDGGVRPTDGRGARRCGWGGARRGRS